ncbi:SEN54 [Candida jiufengensis]|uniref:SEN54 n=1 Tax=Candida jiufengensis TaxID=497108 RepID=UPI00222594CA|nr:SEN54 [Candida jiufengensis]KAI5952667.1 SEN54 [Candida jiufengensis]
MSNIEDDEIPTAEKLESNKELKDEIELEDEIQQDWKQFTSNTKTTSNNKSLIPKRGEKEFEPDGTTVQLTSLQESQNAMYLALSQDRGHHYSKRLVGIWINSIHQCIILNVKGNFFKDMGKVKNEIMYLNDIETVYLVERGSLILYLSNQEVEEMLNKNDLKSLRSYNIEDSLWSLDLEYLYCLTKIDVAKYQIYAYLKRLGYILLEASSDNVKKSESTIDQTGKITHSIFDVSFWLLPRKWGLLPYPALHSLHFKTKCYFNYTNIFKSIALNIQQIDPKPSKDELNITYNVWRPTPQFSKKNPHLPDYQLCVIDSSKNPDYLTFNQIKDLQSKLLKPKDSEKPKPKKSTKTQTSSKVGESKREIRAKKAEERNKKLDKSIQLRNTYLKQRDAGFKYGSNPIIIGIYNYGILNFINISTGNFNCEFNSEKLDAIYPDRDHSIIYNEF